MRGLILFVAMVGVAPAQPVTVPGGVPLRVALSRRVVVKRVGDPIEGRLIEPVYVRDRIAVPAGTVVEGHVAKIGGVPLGRRAISLLSGNLTPPREISAQFDRLVLKDGSRLALLTTPSKGTAYAATVEARTGKHPRKPAQPGQCPGVPVFAAPGQFQRLKSRLFGMLPYHRQSWRAGTVFNAAIEDPLAVPRAESAAAESECRVVAEDGTQQVRARLVTAISSASAHRGDRVEAIVTRPVFAADRGLLIPEGSRLVGEVVSARRGRFFHRNGKLLFSFRQVMVASDSAQEVQGNVEELEADAGANLTLDPEGGVHVTSPKSRFIFPVIAAAVAGLSLHQDYNSEGVPDQDIGGRAESGAVGLGLIGTVVAQASRPLAQSIAFAGAGFSIYTTFFARGAEVALPAGTPMEVSLKTERAAPPVPAK